MLFQGLEALEGYFNRFGELIYPDEIYIFFSKLPLSMKKAGSFQWCYSWSHSVMIKLSGSEGDIGKCWIRNLFPSWEKRQISSFLMRSYMMKQNFEKTGLGQGNQCRCLNSSTDKSYWLLMNCNSLSHIAELKKIQGKCNMTKGCWDTFWWSAIVLNSLLRDG